MKRILLFSAFMTALLLAPACKKNDPAPKEEPKVPGVTLSEVSEYSTVRGSECLVTVSAPEGIAELTITLKDLPSEYFHTVLPHIAITENASGTNKNSPILDVIKDSKAASFLQKLGIPAGEALKGKTATTVNVTALVGELVAGLEDYLTITTFNFVVKVKDAKDQVASGTQSLRYTPAPAFTALFDNPMELNQEEEDILLTVEAPGKLATLILEFETTSPKLAEWIKNRTADKKLTMDLVGDETTKRALKSYIPAEIAGKEEVQINLAFLFSPSFDMASEATSSHTKLTAVATDANGKVKKSEEFVFTFTKN